MVVSLSESTQSLNQKEVVAVESTEETNFVEVSYYKLQNKEPSVELKSKNLAIKNDNLLNFTNPSGLILTKNREIKYSADEGEMNQASNTLTLSGKVALSELNSSYRSDNMQYFGKTDQVFAVGNVVSLIVDERTGDKLNLRSDKLQSQLKTKLLVLEGSVKGSILRARRYEGKMDFSAQNVEVNTPESVVTLSNDVKLHRNNYYLSAGNAEIFLENYNKKLKYYTLYDDVKLEEKLNANSKGESQVRRAYAERLVAHQKTGKIVLTGAPRVEQGSDVIKGYQITLRENVELVEVDDSKSSFNLKRNKQ